MRTRGYGIQAVSTARPNTYGNVQALGHGNFLHWLNPDTDILGPATAEDRAAELVEEHGRIRSCTYPTCWCRVFDADAPQELK